MSGGERIAWAGANALAEEVADLLADACERIAIAGSIRRGKPDIGDIELVAIPKVVTESLPDIFGQPWESQKDELDNLVLTLIDRGELAPRLNKNGQQSIGPKNKFLTYKGFALDVFSTTPAGWAVTLVIRTGSAEFNKRLVTSRQQGGLCPSHLQVNVGEGVIRPRGGGEPIPTPEEADVFRVLGVPWIEPEHRS